MDIIFRLGNTYSGRGRRSKSSGWTYPYDWRSGSQLSSRTWQCTNEQASRGDIAAHERRRRASYANNGPLPSGTEQEARYLITTGMGVAGSRRSDSTDSVGPARVQGCNGVTEDSNEHGKQQLTAYPLLVTSSYDSVRSGPRPRTPMLRARVGISHCRSMYRTPSLRTHGRGPILPPQPRAFRLRLAVDGFQQRTNLR